MQSSAGNHLYICRYKCIYFSRIFTRTNCQSENKSGSIAETLRNREIKNDHYTQCPRRKATRRTDMILSLNKCESLKHTVNSIHVICFILTRLYQNK